MPLFHRHCCFFFGMSPLWITPGQGTDQPMLYLVKTKPQTAPQFGIFNKHPDASFSGLALLSICHTIFTLPYSIPLPLSQKVLIKNPYTL